VKILATVRRVPDLDARFSLNDNQSEIDTEALDHKVNPFDEIGVEEAIKIKESGGADEVVVVCIGPGAATKELRTAMAMGADRAILIEADEKEIDPYVVARALDAIVDEEEPDLVVLGKLGVDFENNQVAQLLAGLRDWPQATFAYETKLEGDTITVGREVDGGTGIMKAKRKPLDQRDLEDVVDDVEPRVETVRFEFPPEREAGQIVESVDELIDKLKEAKLV